MKPASAKRILELTNLLCSIPSVSETPEEENRCADAIYKLLCGITPSNGNTMKVWKSHCLNDQFGREAVFALLKGSKSSGKTVILTGHFDVVSASCYGAKEGLAYDPQALTQSLKADDLEQEVRADLESGNWLFGRGTMDMKSGLALFIATVEELAKQEDLPINILFWAVPDEEANSAGMRGTIGFFEHIVREENLKLIAAFTGEPCFWTEGSEDKPGVRPYYTGTTGKIMPFFYAVGRPAHVGNYDQSFSAALMISEVVALCEADLRLSEGEGLDFLAPPICLDLQIRRDSYSVTVPEKAFAYFNVLTTQKSPSDILKWAKLKAVKAAFDTRAKINEFRFFARLQGLEAKEAPEVSVVDFATLCSVAKDKLDKELFDKKLEQFRKGLRESDPRKQSLAELEYLISLAEIKAPYYVVGFLPPFYPAKVAPKGKAGELIREIVNEAAKEGARLAGDSATAVHNVFAGITDLSYLSGSESQKDIGYVQKQMPGWGKSFWIEPSSLDLQDLPIANMGTAGKDAHKKTERLELKYSLEIAPVLLVQALERLSKQ